MQQTLRKAKRSKYIGRFSPGQLIGNWRVETGEVLLDERGRAFVSCACIFCNQWTDFVSCTHLAKGRSTKCKYCNYSERGRGEIKNPNWRGTENVPKSVLTTISHSCVNNNLNYNLTMNYVDDLAKNANYTCTMTGNDIKPGKTGKIVRIDNSQGYVEGNVMWVHADIANSMRGTDAHTFTSICNAVTSYTGGTYGQEQQTLSIHNSVSSSEGKG